MRQNGLDKAESAAAIMQIAATYPHAFSAGVCQVLSSSGILILKLNAKIAKPIGK